MLVWERLAAGTFVVVLSGSLAVSRKDKSKPALLTLSKNNCCVSSAVRHLGFPDFKEGLLIQILSLKGSDTLNNLRTHDAHLA